MAIKNANLQIYLCFSDQCLLLCQAMSFLWQMNGVFVVLGFKLTADRDISWDKFVTFLVWSFLNLSRSQRNPVGRCRLNKEYAVANLPFQIYTENFVVSIILLWKFFFHLENDFQVIFYHTVFDRSTPLSWLNSVHLYSLYVCIFFL